MANKNLLGIIRQDVGVWNKWRKKNPDPWQADLSEADLSWASLSKANLSKANLSKANLSWANLSKANLSKADLSKANLSGADLSEANLSEANLSKADLSEAYLRKANLSKADLSWANLSEANLSEANLSEANLSEADLIVANLSKADLSKANLSGADLSGANLSKADLIVANLSKADLSKANLSGAYLSRASLVETDLENAVLTGCNIYGISAWKLKLDGAKQNDLIITPYLEPIITVDNLEVAQFIYLILHNEKIRDVIGTMVKKAVLILGRFTPERKIVLDALKDELRRRDYLPILFDFEKSEDQDIAQTVSTLAHMVRFIIADITDAKSIPAELQLIVPNLPLVPVAPIILKSDYKYALFERIMMYNSVLKPFCYIDQKTLLMSITEKVIKPLEEKRSELKDKLDEVRNNS